MAQYEYGCSECGHEFEVERRISDESEQACPECGSYATKRFISYSNFHLRGTGWGGDRQGTDVTDRNWLRKFEGALDDGPESTKVADFQDEVGLGDE